MFKANKIEPISLSWKTIIIKWFQNSTAHALPNIFRTHNIFLQFIWLCCFLTSSTLCVISMINTLNEFLSYSTYINTEIVQEIPTDFPAVTICNVKTINKSASDDSIIQLPVSSYPNVDFFSPFDYMISQIYLTRTVISSSNLSESSRRALGYELENMLISCLFNYQFCNASDFTYLYNPIYGNCYTFNKGFNNNHSSPSIKKVSVSGPLYGLNVELFLGDSKKDTLNEYRDGLVIFVHNQSFIPFYESNNKVMAALGADTEVIISRVFSTKIDTPTGKCIKIANKDSKFSSYYFDFIVRKKEIPYNQKYCIGLCLQNQINNICKCSNTFIPVFDNPLYCSNLTQIDCMVDVVYRFGEFEASSECKNACPIECDSIEYDTKTYTSSYPTHFTKNVLAKSGIINSSNISYENIDKSVLKVSVYYKNMEYMVVKEILTTTFAGFISKIGGTLGLYLGISLLSLIEVFELGFNLILTFINSKKIKKQVIYQLSNLSPTTRLHNEKSSTSIEIKITHSIIEYKK